MELSALAQEAEIIRHMMRKKCTEVVNFCAQDFSNLTEPWCDPQVLDMAVCAFSHIAQDILMPTDFPPLDVEFQETQTKLTDRVHRVIMNGVSYLMKEEEYSKSTDFLLHEYFVGLHLNQLKHDIPTFAGMIGVFGCTPEFHGKACEFVGTTDANVNFILYQFVQGPTLMAAVKDDLLSIPEAWTIIKIVIASIQYAHNKLGFIHQDLHWENIILHPLQDPTEIMIGTRSFTSRYLPVIIDYGRGQINVHGKIFSAKDSFLGIPAQNTYFDVRYLMLNFANATHYFDVFFADKSLTDPIPEKTLKSAFDFFESIYGTQEIPTNVLHMSRYIPGVTYAPCKPKLPPPDLDAYIFRAGYLKSERDRDRLVADIGQNKPMIVDHLSQYFAIMAKYKLPLFYENEATLIDDAMRYVVMSQPLTKRISDLQETYQQFVTAYQNDPRYVIDFF